MKKSRRSLEASAGTGPNAGFAFFIIRSGGVGCPAGVGVAGPPSSMWVWVSEEPSHHVGMGVGVGAAARYKSNDFESGGI